VPAKLRPTLGVTTVVPGPTTNWAEAPETVTDVGDPCEFAGVFVICQPRNDLPATTPPNSLILVPAMISPVSGNLGDVKKDVRF
jgi:hypothetical protein